MASISASVELYDRMSAPLMSIMNAMNMRHRQQWKH